MTNNDSKDLYSQESYCRENTPRHIIIKLLKNKEKEKILPERKGTLYTRELECKWFTIKNNGGQKAMEQYS